MGVSFLIGGVYKDEPMVFETDVGGDIYGWHAQVIGKGREDGRKVLKDEWKEGLTEKQAKKLAIKCLKQGKSEVSESAVKLAVIDDEGFRYAEAEEIKQLL